MLTGHVPDRQVHTPEITLTRSIRPLTHGKCPLTHDQHRKRSGRSPVAGVISIVSTREVGRLRPVAPSPVLRQRTDFGVSDWNFFVSNWICIVTVRIFYALKP